MCIRYNSNWDGADGLSSALLWSELLVESARVTRARTWVRRYSSVDHYVFITERSIGLYLDDHLKERENKTAEVSIYKSMLKMNESSQTDSTAFSVMKDNSWVLKII